MKLRFEPFEIDLTNGVLLKQGSRVDVEAIPARLLAYLAANRHRIVTKAELAREVWGSLSVDESSLHQAIRKARRAVDDDGRKQSVIETISRRGYRFVSKALKDPRSADRPGAGDTAYVGRRELLASLAERIADLSAGRGGLLLLEGEAGIGKTRTVDAFEELAARAGIPAVRGGANPPMGAPPFWAWSEALRALARIRPTTNLREGVPHLFRWPPDPAVADTEPDRFRDLEKLASGLRELARNGPFAIVLEDLHRAGFSTWEILEYVASRATEVPLLLVATFRPATGASEEAWRPLSRRIVDSGLARRHEIAPLGEIETAYLVEQAGAPAIPPNLIGELHRHTLGIPFFALQLAEMLGDDDGSPETWTERLEHSALDLLRSRLAGLGETARSLLSLASVYGSEFDASELDRLEHGLPQADALAEASARHLVRHSPTTEGAYQFAHGLVRDAFYADFMSRDEQGCRSTHLAIARTLGPERSSEAAHHLCAAGPLAGARSIARGVIRAAAESAGVGDLEGAIALCDLGIQTIDGFTSADDPARLDLLITVGELGVRGMDSERARTRLDEAIDLARTQRRGGLLARAVLARVYRTEIVGLADTGMIDLLREAIEALGGTAIDLSAMLHSRLAVELRYAPDGDASAAIDEALSLAAHAGDARARARVLEDASLVRWSVEDPEAWRDLNQSIVAASTEARDTELLFQGVKGLATAYLELGDREGFERERRRCEELAETHPSPFLRAVVAGLRGTRAFLDADLPAAERCAIEGASAGLDAITPLAAGQLYYHRLETGRLGETEDAIRGFAAGSPGVAIWPIALARCMVATGRLDEARGALRDLGPLESIPKDRNWLPAIALFAEAAALARDADLARAARSALAPYAHVNVVMGNGSLFAGQTAHYLGMLGVVLGDHAEASASLDRALEMHRAMGAESWCLRTQAEQLHLAASATDDPVELAMAEPILERAEALGLVACAERARSAMTPD